MTDERALSILLKCVDRPLKCYSVKMLSGENRLFRSLLRVSHGAVGDVGPSSGKRHREEHSDPALQLLSPHPGHLHGADTRPLEKRPPLDHRALLSVQLDEQHRVSWRRVLQVRGRRTFFSQRRPTSQGPLPACQGPEAE